MIEEQEPNYRIQTSQLSPLFHRFKLTYRINSDYTIIKIAYPLTQPITHKLIHHSISSIQFAILLFHHLYPFEPPLLICLTNFTCPRWDDFRDFLQEVLGEKWWPSLSIMEIILKTQEFVQKISVLNPHKIGSRKIMFGLPRRIIQTYGSGLNLVEAQIYNKEDSFIGKYEQITLGIGWYDFVVFKPDKQNPHNLFIKKVIPFSSISHIQVSPKKGKKCSEERVPFLLSIQLKSKKSVSIRISQSQQKKERRKLDESRVMEHQQELNNNPLFFLKILQQHLNLKQILKNCSFEERVEKLSQMLQNLITINDDIVVLYYRLKLRSQIQKKYTEEEKSKKSDNTGDEKIGMCEEAPSQTVILDN